MNRHTVGLAVVIGIVQGLVAGSGLGCRGDSGTTVADAATDTPPDGPDKARNCTSTFGTGLPPGFGRIDGTILAVIPPGDEACAKPNATHLIVEVTTTAGVFRMVVDVLSNQGSPDVLFDELDAPLAGDPWADGWHPAQALDYPTMLGLHSAAFTAMHEADLVDSIAAELELDARISIFATVGATEPDSAHLVHRNATNADGAIVIHPDTAPHYLVLRFDEQLF